MPLYILTSYLQRIIIEYFSSTLILLNLKNTLTKGCVSQSSNMASNFDNAAN